MQTVELLCISTGEEFEDTFASQRERATSQVEETEERKWLDSMAVCVDALAGAVVPDG